uniref:Uncharacterized protein n=1 Tax=Arundo donax TaxID=35708 RepID=A0A0A8Y279_ARUDO
MKAEERRFHLVGGGGKV